MKVYLSYGKNGLSVEVPDTNLKKVLRIQKTSGIPHPVQTVRQKLKYPLCALPLQELAHNKRTAVVVISDVTRPVPNSIVLPPILESLQSAGLTRNQITILIATGLHRPNLGEELRCMVGDAIYGEYRIINHDARDSSSLTRLGKTKNGTPAYCSSFYLNASLKITTGYIEPHIFAGFSGGRKLVCPGLAGMETIKRNHSPRFLENPRCREGMLDDNPLHAELLEIARMAGCDFILNVALNEEREITGIFTGDMISAHLEGVDFVRRHVRDTVSEPVDIVITTSAGYPLDTSFYQAIKGLTAALPAVRKGGTIILAASCSEGLGDPAFTAMVREYYDMNRFLDAILHTDEVMINQWQYEELGKVLKKAEVLMYSEGIPAQDKTNLPVIMLNSVEEGIDLALRKYSPDASIVVIPSGPYVFADV